MKKKIIIKGKRPKTMKKITKLFGRAIRKLGER